MINDVSGLSDESMAERMRGHRRRARDHAHARGAEDEGLPRLRRRRGRRPRLPRGAHGGGARSPGSRRSRSCSTPASTSRRRPPESVELLRRLPEFAQLGRPLLLAVSRKDFVGALTERPPADRDAGHARRRGRGACAAGRASSACTTWRARATICACTTRSRTARTARSSWQPSCRGRPCERRASDDRAAVRPPLRLAALRAEPARPRDRRGQRARSPTWWSCPATSPATATAASTSWRASTSTRSTASA